MDNLEQKCGCCGSKRIWLAVLAILVIGAIVIIAIVRDRIVNPPQWQISSYGQGKVYYQPDTAKITLGVQVDKVPTADQALNKLNEKVKKINDAMIALGIAKEDIQTQNYSLYPQYDTITVPAAVASMDMERAMSSVAPISRTGETSTTRVSGYNANQTMIIKVKGVDQNQELTSKVIAEATKAGANQVNGISFEASNFYELKQQARLLAMEDAKKKAKEISQTLDVKLDQVVSWWENYITPMDNTAMYSEMGKGGGGASVAPVINNPNQEIVIEVNLSYKLK